MTQKKPIRIAFAMTKGGAGKTTSAAAFATELAEQGYKVLLVDTDTQSLIRHALAAMDSTYGLYDLADGVPFEDVVYKFTDHKDSPKPRQNLDVVVSQGNLSLLASGWAKAEQDLEGQFLDAMEIVERNTDYDYILVDTSPTEGLINTNVFYYVHHILCPVALSSFHVLGLDDFIDIIEKTRIKKAKRKDSELAISWILPTRLHRGKRTSELLMNKIRETAVERLPETKILDAIPECARTDECAIFGQSVLEYDRNSRGGRAYLKVIKEMINDQNRKTNRKSASGK